MEPGDAATWWGVAASATLGVGGLVSGFVANRRANQAVAAAKESNRIANEANEISAASNEIAKQSNVIAERADSRATEVHDVRWEGHWQAPGEYRLVNIGRDAAHEVYSEFVLDEEKAVERATTVPSGGFIQFDMPRAASAWRTQQQTLDARFIDDEEAQAEAARTVPQSLLPAMASMRQRFTDPLEFAHYLSELVHWKSASGAPHEYQDSHNMTHLDPRPT